MGAFVGSVGRSRPENQQKHGQTILGGTSYVRCLFLYLSRAFPKSRCLSSVTLMSDEAGRLIFFSMKFMILSEYFYRCDSAV